MGYWVVVVDDEPLSLTNARNLLSANDMKVSCLRSGSDLLKFMGKNEPDLILLDILMPGMDGFETYKALRMLEEKEGKGRIPVIFLTGENNKETERRGLKAGASDFIRKPFDRDVLVKRIKNTIENSRTIESLTEEARLDKLTGFLNKASGIEKVSQLCESATGALTILDLDNFKLVNDLYGHDMGDRILEAFADVFRHNIRENDVVSRIGGDEFMAFFAGVSEAAEVAGLTNRLNDQLSKRAEALMGKDHGIPLGISVGAAFAPGHSKDYQLLFQYADSSLYRVKQNGKHSFQVYDVPKEDADMEKDLNREITRLTQIVEERGDGRGAMLLGQDVFVWEYRFIMRFLDRFEGVVNRVLFEISAEEKGPLFSEIMAEFGAVLRSSLRRYDIIFQCSQNRFFVVLPQLTEKDGETVVRRIMGAWEKKGYQERVRIEYAMSFLSLENNRN